VSITLELSWVWTLCSELCKNGSTGRNDVLDIDLGGRKEMH